MFYLKRIQKYFLNREQKRLAELFYIKPKAKVLDISCGRGNLLSVLHSFTPTATFMGIDMSEEAIMCARKRYKWGSFSISKAESLPEGNPNFDVVICTMSLHHYQYPEKVFQEIARVLSPKGILYIGDLIARNRLSQIWNNLQKCPEPYHFERYYRIEEIESMATKAGMILISNKRIGWFPETRIVSLRKRIFFTQNIGTTSTRELH